MQAKLLLATNNRGKAAEYRRLLAGVPFQLVTPEEIGIATAIEETGKTFAENAILKATTLAQESGLPALADDSGLEVEALNGAPGTLSARYAGANATDDDRVKFLLEKLKGVPPEKRAARFVCVIAIAAPDGSVELCQGECPGVITLEPQGTHGFGYDPVFLIPALNRTMAELTMEQKNAFSHRAKAAEKAREILERG